MRRGDKFIGNNSISEFHNIYSFSRKTTPCYNNIYYLKLVQGYNRVPFNCNDF